jgi:AcrR family transcriptional regulator
MEAFMVKREERKEKITEYRQQQILNAALEVFSQKGYGEATIPDIARQAGVAVGTIYNYYESKHDLLVSLVNTFIVTEPLRELLKQSPKTKVDEKTLISSIIENRLDFGFENLDKFFLVFTEILRDSELRQKFSEQVISPLVIFPENHLSAKIASGDFRPMDHRIIFRAMFGMVIGFMLLRKLEGEKSPTQGMTVHKLAEQLADFVLYGLKTRG